MKYVKILHFCTLSIHSFDKYHVFFSKNHLKLNTYKWKLIETHVNEIAKKEHYGNIDFKNWLCDIMDSYCSNSWFYISDKLTKLHIWDYSKMHSFIPTVATNRFHVLPKEAEKILDLTRITIDEHDMLFSFKLAHDENLPFMVILQTHNVPVSALSANMKIGTKEVSLTLTDEITTDGYSNYYMGKQGSSRHYSYLPSFKQLFLDSNKQYQEFISIEFGFDWCQMSP